MSDTCYGDFNCHVADSSISLARDCMFKFYSKKVAKRAKKTQLAAAGKIGSACHEEIEAYKAGHIDEKSLTTLSQIAVQSVPFRRWKNETVIDHEDIGLAWRVYGYIDIDADDEISDFKFSSNPAEYMDGNAKEGDVVVGRQGQNRPTIRSNAQLLIYAAAKLKRTGRLVRIGQVQMDINTGQPRIVRAKFGVVEFLRRFEELRVIVERMHTATQQRPEEVETAGYPGTAKVCWKYNKPCPSLEHCTEVEKLRLREKEETAWTI